MAPCPCRAKVRISSRHSHGFFSRFNLSTRCAFVSCSTSADVLMFLFLAQPTSDSRSKAKRPTACSGDGPFLNLDDYVLGSGFISQRRAGRLTATSTHSLAQNSHKQKVHGLGEGVKG